MLSNDVDVVQSGVQLMNFDTNWYSMYNVLEYYFWFKSVLHFFAKNGVVPLGGNTVFFKRKYLNHVGGWDEACLTEDADIGMRLSLAGAKMKIVYDEIHATREETPPTVWEFVKQRTRWDQGFMQVIGKLDWARLPSFKQKFLAIYALGWVVAQGFLFLIIPFSIYIGMTTKMHPGLSILTNLPMYSLLVIFIILNIGLYEFTKSYGLKYSWTTPFKMLIYYIPFQLLLGFSALRAMWRQIAGQVSWEKTTHLNIARSK
jgi:cellulose synthase/poly-beta-1,6-N-acetylglucosamine synthase-like glycosyltransferase